MWSRVRGWHQHQCAEIQDSRALRWYGFFLSIPILVTYFFWRFPISRMADSKSPLAICWEFFPQCETYSLHKIGAQGLSAYWILCLSLAVASGLYFISGNVKIGWWLLLGATLLKAIFQISDYNLMGNYHYMHYVVVIAFLFFPDKKRSIKIFLFLFYLFAGLLKLNEEWLSGAALSASLPWVSPALYSWMLSYVVALELILSFGLLAKNNWVRGICVAQFFLFHVASWFIVGHFYPTVMFCLLSLFVLSFRESLPAIQDEIPRATLIYLYAFVLAQIIPLLSFRDPAIHTTWRLSALNMFDARVICEGGIYVRTEKEILEYIPYLEKAGSRLRCDPVLYLEHARSLCREMKGDKKFKNLDILLSARRSTTQDFESTLQKTNVCGENP